jgi:hypothetical protein
MLNDLAFGDRIHNVGDAGILGELILAILELATRFKRDDTAHEDVRLINDTFALQKVSNVSNSEPSWDIHHLALSERARCFKPLSSDEEDCGRRD